jgi:hypothetical protein
MKKLLALLMCASLMACDAATLQKTMETVLATNSPLSNAQIGNGLKQALELGVGEGASKLSQVNGFLNSPYKVLLPAEVRQVTDKLKNIPGFNLVEDKMVNLLNEAAEDAAKSAKPIFVNAIKQMTFTDATNILMGSKNSATTYLQNKTTNPLYAAFSPTVGKSLDKVNATSYWKKAMDAYNKIPFVKQVNPDLKDYVTTQAMKGMFSMVEKKEADIRTNVGSRTTDLMRQVFAKQD